MAELYDDGNYRAQAPEPEYRRRIRPENFFASQGSVIDASDTAGPLITNAAINTTKDVSRLAAAAGSRVPGFRSISRGADRILSSPLSVGIDKAQSAVGPVVQFLTDANPSQDANHNKYVDLGVSSAGAVAEYGRMIPSPYMPVAWALGGSAEGIQNGIQARQNAGFVRMYDPSDRETRMNDDVINQVANGAMSSWGRGSAWGMVPFNPYDRLSSAMGSEVARLAGLVNTQGGSDDAYYKDVGDQLTNLADLIRLAAEEEDDRASPASIFGGGEFAKLQVAESLGSPGGSREQKDARTLQLLRQASENRKKNKAIQSAEAARLKEAVLNGYHLDPHHAPASKYQTDTDRTIWENYSL